MENADVVEVLWLVIIACCVLISSLNVWSARMDWQKWKDSPNVSHVFLSHAIYTSSKVILLAKVCILYGAVWSVFHPPPPPSIWDTQSWANIVVLGVVSLVLTVHSTLTLKYRRQIGAGAYGSFGRRATDVARERTLENVKKLVEIDEKANEIKEKVAQIDPLARGVDDNDSIHHLVSYDGEERRHSDE